MKKLLSLPPNLVRQFHDLEQVSTREWFCSSDPEDYKLGSGGGTAWLLQQAYLAEHTHQSFAQWLAKDKRILMHAGGQSRRLPAYAPSGKVLTPIPVFRWARGQRLGQNLLSLQLPLYERIMQQAPDRMHTLIASGDVYIRSESPLATIPDVDIVCYGLWVDPSVATNHGVFFADRRCPEQLDFAMQKPSLAQLEALTSTHYFLMDIGVWLLSDKAVEVLMQRSYCGETPVYYDLYSDFGCALGSNPRKQDDAVNSLSVAIVPLPHGEFYHYGTSRELISSTLRIQNIVTDQQRIMHHKVKPNPALFVQNARVDIMLQSAHENIWIENSHISAGWTLRGQHLLTGIPENNWQIGLREGICVDIVPVGDHAWAIRPYGMNDAFRGALNDSSTRWMEAPVCQWLQSRGLKPDDICGDPSCDLQSAPLFPIVTSVDEMGALLAWMVEQVPQSDDAAVWLRAERLSADQLSVQANLSRLYRQRESFARNNWKQLADNYEKSVFYQLDLNDAAKQLVKLNLAAPAVLPDHTALMLRIHNRMLRARIAQVGHADFEEDRQAAFQLLGEGMTDALAVSRQQPQLQVYKDQIVWARSSVRIDLAGGWTDTPPYSLYAGGNVVNLAIELNGQPPLQVYIKPSADYRIILRSIDMGAMEVVDSFEQILNYKQVGSAFAIPKAALALAGFAPPYCTTQFSTLTEQLKAFGSGLEITLLAAIPAGSGLGTSSILAATVLGALNDFCGLQWDKATICLRTLVLEQLLTTGGGWQDQYGGVLHGLKLLQSEAGLRQDVQVHWLPDHMFTHPEYKPCHLLYYTGVTRTAKHILADIVEGMFLNQSERLNVLNEMKIHTLRMAETIQRGSFSDFGRLVGCSWLQNQTLDAGTNPPSVQGILERVHDYTLGYKLPGAGGGGYIYMVAKDPQAALRIREELTNRPPNGLARFVEMSLSDKGLQISRS